jgi:hypothetical protein
MSFRPGAINNILFIKGVMGYLPHPTCKLGSSDAKNQQQVRLNPELISNLHAFGKGLFKTPKAQV